VISAVEYARDAKRYLLLPDLSICSDGPVRSVVLFSKRPASELHGRRVLVSRSSMTSVALLELLFEDVWDAKPAFVPSDAELSDVARFGDEDHDARLVIGDAALHLWSRLRSPESLSGDHALTQYRFAYDLGAEWKSWTGLPFVFAVWVAQRTAPVDRALAIHAGLIASRDWGLQHLDALAAQAALATGVLKPVCAEYLSGLDYGLSYPHLAGLTEFFRRLVAAGKVPDGSLAFLPAA
jgi:chorismate dehydratase